MRVIGIDPGTRHLGWGVVERHGSRVLHVAHGVVDVDTEGAFASRLVQLDDALAALMAEHAPVAGAVESLFFAKDAQSAAKLGHARGVVLLRLSRAGVAVHEYAPALVKRTVVGRGAADKHQVAMVMTAVLGLKEPPRSDAADALAIAMTHLHVANFNAAMAASGLPLPATKGRARRPGWATQAAQAAKAKAMKKG
ncbi:crossover junction endodeoxyribonuclease RuvC [Chondromyces apiculatus]|uniref:Crossover junction endodeoxyribonuclease RuvC n=1 Tax=Chondromyces apiculatus DSM 436 TaxID=1192034 RepID=A0A017TDF8_9BACT|nr:crossover junction endodeoxyribonuclease RuvC [Chondromyces apiculatus]EYF06952.1 Crossover junction endodeoxyribonuclease RuvC [Chondromyces apiculatus DSM 436]